MLQLALALAAQSAPAELPTRRYSVEFERGVAALVSGEREEAAEAFHAAGALAPAAPLWPLYLAALDGQAAAPLDLQPDGGGPWGLVDEHPRGSVQFSPGGASLLSYGASVCVWDAMSGALASEVTPAVSNHGGVPWFSDRSGRFLVSERLAVGTQTTDERLEMLESLELRRLANGEPACAPLRIFERTALGAITVEWSKLPFALGSPVEDNAWFFVRRFDVDGGTLTAWIPRFDGVGETRPWATVSDDGARALLTSGPASDEEVGTWVSLIALAVPEELCRIKVEGSPPRFSRDGRLVLAGTREGALAVYDAETGAPLTVPDEVQPRLGFGSERLVPIFDHAGTLLIADHQRVRTWDPRAGEWLAEVMLEPALDDSRWLFEWRRAFCVLDRARVLVFASHAGVVVHDADSGVRLWSRRGAHSSDWTKAWHDAPGASRIAFIDEHRSIQVVDARTGEPAGPLRVGTESVVSVTPVVNHLDLTAKSHEAALVITAAGELRTFTLATGMDLARSDHHVGQRVEGVRLGFLGGSPFELSAVTWDDAGRVALWGVPELLLRAELRLEPFVEIAGVCVRTGTVTTSRAGTNGAPFIEVRRIDGGAVIVGRQMGALVASAVHEDSGHIALVSTDEIVALDTATGALRRRCALSPPPLGMVQSVCAFHGSERLVLSWCTGSGSDAPGVGIDVYDLVEGARIGTYHAQGAAFPISERWVDSIVSMPDLGRVAFVLSEMGEVFLVEDSQWTELAQRFGMGGGTGASFELTRAGTSPRLCLSGIATQSGAIVGAATLEVPALGKEVDLFNLAESPQGRYFVGLDHGRVHVLDGETFEQLYVRQELTGPMSRIVHADGHIVERGVGPMNRRHVHIARDGASHPLACFEAWLNDPLQLGGVTLTNLPAPPQLVGGPDRSMQAEGAEVTLRFVAEDPRGLLGAWVVAAGRAPRFLPADALPDGAPNKKTFEVSLEGAWPLDVELIAVSVTGLESKPWRTRIQ